MKFSGYQDITLFDRARQKHICVSVWYPTVQEELNVTYLAHFHSKASINAEIDDGLFPVVMISHGSRGHRYNQYYLAEYLSRFGYIVVAVEHAGDSTFDDVLSEKDENHVQRIEDILFVYAELKNISVIADHMNLNKIAHIGHSFGGFSSFILSGGDSELIPCFISKKIKNLFLENIKCVVMLAPAFVGLVKNNKKLSIPALLIIAKQDEVLFLTPKRYLACFSRAEYVSYNNAGHYAFVMECPEQVAGRYPEVAIDVGIPRKFIHAEICPAIKNYLDKQLR